MSTQSVIDDIHTPAILVDLDAVEHNLGKYAKLAEQYGKQIWPMTKTHKSSEMLRLQKKYGATGYLCGTIDECEIAARIGLGPIMYAYPVSTVTSIDRLLQVAKKQRLILRIDSSEAAAIINEEAVKNGQCLDYTIIIDSGLHRFGIPAENVVELAEALEAYANLHFCGISSHPGHVYACRKSDEVPAYAKQEVEALHTAYRLLKQSGRECEIVSSGSTPTFAPNLKDDVLQIYHPGNYIFNDCIQMSTGTATEEECALTILASVIAHPREDLFLCDAGAKCLGLDQGAHGNASVVGHGKVIGHPELVLDSLSEEVAKIHVNGTTNLKIGDKIRIIPNHSCSSANLTDYYVGIRGNRVDHLIAVDIRGNRTTKGLIGI